MSRIPRYLAKYRKAMAQQASSEAFGDFLAQLDAADWRALIEALLVSRPAAIYEVIAPASSSGLLEYAARLLQQASPASMHHFADAVDAVLSEAHRRIWSDKAHETLIAGLRLVEMLGDYSRPDAARELLFDKTLPPQIRLEAALAVAGREDCIVEWRGFDLERESYLLPAIVAGLFQENAADAIHALVSTPAAPENPGMLEYPVRLTIRRLLRLEGPARAAQFLDTIPPGHWARSFVWQGPLAAHEFTALRGILEEVGEERPTEDQSGDSETLSRLASNAAEAARDVWDDIDIEEWRDRANSENVEDVIERLLESAGAAPMGAEWGADE